MENWEIMIKIKKKKYNLRLRKVNDIVGNNKSNYVDFKRIEIDEANANDVQENEDYVEMVQSDVNCISGHPTNMFSLSGVNHHDFIKVNTRCIKCLTLKFNIISFF